MSNHDESCITAAREPRGFGFEVRLQAGLTRACQNEFQRKLEDYCSERDLQCRQAQTMGSIWGANTDVTLADQCDFLCWLELQPEVCGATVSALKAVHGIEDVEGPQLRMDALSAACSAGCLLFRLSLLSPEGLARALGGFVQPLYEI